MAQLVFKNVWKKYGEVEAVKDLSFECKDGEFLALLGPSGCGKSSTLKMIAGLEEITKGEIHIGDILVNNLKPGARNIALAFENYALYPPLTVLQNIAFPLQALGTASAEVDKEVKDIARILGLTDILNRKPSRLSGGQQQLTSLARALVKAVSVYLLDEPISHLDADLRSSMRGELKRIHKEMRATFLYVTHDQLEALSMADRIAILNFGVLQQIGTPNEIFNHPANLFVAGFIGEPPMNLLETEIIRKEGETYGKVDGAMLSIPKKIADKISQPNETEFYLGIRPNDLMVSKEKSENCCVPSEVYIYEHLGDRTILTVRVGKQTLLIETSPEFKADMGEVIWIGYNPDKIHFFNKETGNAIM